MLTAKATTVSLPKLLLWLFLICLQAAMFTSATACDKDSFVFETFGLRCQRISEYIKDLQIARKMNLPVAAEKRSKLLNEWVTFYLDHGQAPPASFTLMTTQNWSRTLTRAGETIGQFAYEKITPEEADLACIPFDLLAQQDKLETVMTLIASWSEVLQESPGETISQTSDWLARNLGIFVQINRTIGPKYAEELKSSHELVTLCNQQWKFVLEAPQGSAQTVYRFTRQELADRFTKEFERWRQLAFM